MDQARFDAVFERYIGGGRFFEVAPYYHQFKDRYASTLRWIERVLPPGGRMLDIGSGQFAVLCRWLLDARCDVLDIDSRSAASLRDNDVGFTQLDLSTEVLHTLQPYDLVVMAEVIEHVPTPPHVVFGNLIPAVRPGGHLLVTTPNLYRLRNLIRMSLGKQVFDYFLVPGPDNPLGHFIEYSRDQLNWQASHAGWNVIDSTLEQLSWGGASAKARLGRRLLAPLLLLHPLWRDNLVLLAQRSPAASSV